MFLVVVCLIEICRMWKVSIDPKCSNVVPDMFFSALWESLISANANISGLSEPWLVSVSVNLISGCTVNKLASDRNQVEEHIS